jgi:hypothetical protein
MMTTQMKFNTTTILPEMIIRIIRRRRRRPRPFHNGITRA